MQLTTRYNIESALISVAVFATSGIILIIVSIVAIIIDSII
jgi:hypothetical protein